MLEFDVQSRSRKCAKTDRPFEPGEEFFSVLLPEGSNVVRYDYAAEAWEGPPENSIGWWQSQVPDHRANKVSWAPNEVMLHYFEQLDGNEEKQDVRYVLALLMVRRRILRWEENEPAEVDPEKLELFCPLNENTYEVGVADPSPARAAAIQEELAELLFSDS